MKHKINNFLHMVFGWLGLVLIFIGFSREYLVDNQNSHNIIREHSIHTLNNSLFLSGFIFTIVYISRLEKKNGESDTKFYIKLVVFSAILFILSYFVVLH
jgi:hypothetical protein